MLGSRPIAGTAGLLGLLPLAALAQDAGFEPDPAGIELSQLLAEVEAVRDRLIELDGFLQPYSSEAESVQVERIEALGRDLEEKLTEAEAKLARPQSRADIDAGVARWDRWVEQLEQEKTLVEKAIAELEGARTDLSELSDRWSEIRRTWRDKSDVSREVLGPALEQVREVLTALQTRTVQVTERLQPQLQLQNQLAERRRAAGAILARYEAELELARSLILTADSPPLWSPQPQAQTVAEHLDEAQRRLRKAFSEDFFERYERIIPLHVLFILALLALAAWTRIRLRTSKADDRSDDRARLGARPFSAALVLGLVASLFFYDRLTVEVRYVIGLLGIVPVLRYSARLVGPPLDQTLWLLGGLFVAHRVYLFMGTNTWFGRTLLFGTAIAGVLVCVRALRSPERRAITRRHRVFRLVDVVLPIFTTLLAVGAAAELFGLAGLARVLVGGSLLSLYAAVILASAAMIFLSLFRLFLGSDLGQRLRSVRLHRARIETEIRGWLQLGFALWWVYEALDRFEVADPAIAALDGLLRAPIEIGSASFRLLDGVLLVVTLWASLQLARLIRFVLDEEVLPPLPLARGVPVAISRGISYVVIALGFLLSVAAAGISLGQLTVIFGAFGVGIGFGLQNLVNNFVSGLILIFERPVAIGDLVEFQNQMGHVQSIGIRASIVRTFSGAEIIVPNGDLVSFQVVNWNLSDRRRRVEIQVAVPVEDDPDPAIDVLIEAAKAHPNIVDDPEPTVNVRGIQDGATVMDLWCWTTDTSVTIRTKSEITRDLVRRFRGAGIRIAVPRRGLQWEDTSGPGRE